MAGPRVLDSWAILAYFEGEKEGSRVTEILKDAALKDRSLLLSTVSWGEVLYVIEARYGPEKRDEIEHLMDQMNLEVVDIDRTVTRVAAHLKAQRRLPYADCFAAALAKLHKAAIVTGDKDFKVLERDIKVEWL